MSTSPIRAVRRSAWSASRAGRIRRWINCWPNWASLRLRMAISIPSRVEHRRTRPHIRCSQPRCSCLRRSWLWMELAICISRMAAASSGSSISIRPTSAPSLAALRRRARTGNSIGDGCPATQAVIGDAGNGIGVGADPLGNIYIADTQNGRIRKVSTGLQSPASRTNWSLRRPSRLSFTSPRGMGRLRQNAVATASTGGSSARLPAPPMQIPRLIAWCSPRASRRRFPGARWAPLLVTSSEGSTANLGLTGIGLGSGATLDPASQASFGSGVQVVGLATDNAGNTPVADAVSKNLLRYGPTAAAQGTSATKTVLATLTAPGAVAVDPRGFVYVADTSTGLIRSSLACQGRLRHYRTSSPRLHGYWRWTR